jgi:undecaprenyl-phosphate 4-deoxy-4-formamido-L-arabinose transferase
LGYTPEQQAVTSLSIVVPVYNSQESLPELVAELARVLPTLVEQYEVIFVNDGSRDKSWDVVQQLSREYAWVRGFDLMRNYGQHNALLCGIRAAQYELIATMDDDLQHPPVALETLLNKLNEGYDVVYGTPQKQQHGLLRDLASEITKLALQSSMGVDVARNVSAFRLFRTPLREGFLNYRGSFINIDVLLTWSTTRFAAIPVRHDERKFGVSNYTFRKLVTHALNMITGFSVLPLQLASMIGFVFTVFGILIFVYVVGRYIVEGGVVPGFPFLASIIAIFSGAQLFALGIIGEYLARMHFRLMDRPSYLVRSEAETP